ncbi:hypothetical protein [Winogradskyella algicola]|uniref:hypothetical protein n=1 Tax=Winogradskyella algicola TaxID=2575815 RepID=UPI001109063E|nr:hypothetical protein [Winogradskyella algicola]
MNYTEDYCKELLLKVINDLERQRGKEYYDENRPFEAYFEKNQKNLYSKEIIENSWLVCAHLEQDDYWKTGKIIVLIDDDSGKALTFVNTKFGRPITFPLEIDEEGKYYIPNEILPE